MSNRSNQTVVVWYLLDGRPGHENQVRGLAEALQRQADVLTVPISLKGRFRGYRALTPGSTRHLQQYPAPDLILGAGHASHIPLWTAARRFRASSVVLMKPTLPLRLFDLCLVSDVDHPVRPAANVVLTRGVLNRIQPSHPANAQQGLILVGGPSKHFRWSDRAVLEQVRAVVEDSPQRGWKVVTSRRTPDGFRQLFQQQSGGTAAELVCAEDVDSAWLPQAVAGSGIIWVTQDSMSMTYEALTSGCRVGVIELPGRPGSRLASGAQRLAASGDVTSWSRWLKTGSLPLPARAYHEADRCAALILQRQGVRPAVNPVPIPESTCRQAS